MAELVASGNANDIDSRRLSDSSRKRILAAAQRASEALPLDRYLASAERFAGKLSLTEELVVAKPTTTPVSQQ
jgi:hypothetical protein